MSVTTAIENEFARVKAWVETIFSSGAPHQQALAKDVNAVVTHLKATAENAASAASAGVTTAVSEVETVAKSAYDELQQKLELDQAKLLDKTYDLAAQVGTLQAHVANLVDDKAALQAEIDRLKMPTPTVTLTSLSGTSTSEQPNNAQAAPAPGSAG